VTLYDYEGNEWSARSTDYSGSKRASMTGWSTDISNDGQILIIGAPGDQNVNGVSAGQVAIYKVE